MKPPATPDLATLSADEKRRLLAELLARKRAPQRFVLTAAQRRLWFIEQLSPGLAAYHLPAAAWLEGALDVPALQSALNGVLQRHEILRAQFHDDAGEPWLAIGPATPLPLLAEAVADESAVPPALRALVAAPFKLQQGPLLRARLLQVAPQRHALLLCVHHLVADHASLRLLMRDLAALYAGLPLAPLALQYVDYAAWQAGREAQLDEQRRWWCQQLADAPPDLPLPTDRPRPPVQHGHGAVHSFVLPPALAQGLRNLARQAQASLFATLLAGWQALLARCSGQHDVWVGTLVSQRDRPETQALVGLFVNNLVLRARVDGQASFRQLLAQVRQTTLDALAHQALPFEQLVDTLRVERRLDRHPLFQTSFVLHEADAGAVRLPGLQIQALQADTGSTRFDLGLDLSDDGQAVQGRLEYDRALFDAARIARLAQQYQLLLQAALQAPDVALAALDLLDDAERAHLAAHQPSPRPLPATDVLQRVLQQAREQPAAEALRVPAGAGQQAQIVRYAELVDRITRIADALAALPSGAVVGLCLPRGADLPAALLACLARGLTYLPLDPAQPPARLAALLREGEAQAVLVAAPDAALAQALPCPAIDLAQLRDDRPLSALQPLPQEAAPHDHIAYLIFTSGTTGRPKGVPISQGSLLNLLQAMARQPGLARGDALLAVTTVAFDIAALELLLPLMCGARLVLADRDTVADGAALAQLLHDEAITHLQATPALWRLLLASGWQGRDGLVMLCGGEALDLPLAQRLLQAAGPRGALWNVYGPTETTIWSAALQVTPALLQGTGAPIGGPVDNTTLAVLAPDGRALPTGLAGELAIGGLGLSPGYWRQPELDAQRFTWLDGQRLYRTGDLVRRREDGHFDYLGRLDHQIKLRGFRIEPAEIEAALAAQPAVAQALVLLHGSGDAARLVAYLVARADHAADTVALRQAVAATLPAYMQPATWIWLPTLPLSANGKVDRRQLPAPNDASDEPGAPAEPPQGDTEQALAAVWAELLQQPVADRHASFFALGGHSLLAARLMARIGERWGHSLPLRTLFEQPTLHALAAAIDQAQRAAVEAQAPAPAPIPRLPAGSAPPLSPSQQRLWVLAQLEPDSPHYTIAAAVRWHRPLPAETLRARLQRLLQRHDNLRSRFVDDQGQPRLVIEPTLDAPLQWLQPVPGQSAREQLAAEARRPFDLSQAPLWRVQVLPAEPGEDGHGQHVMVVMHHILADAASLARLVHELQSDAEPPPLALQYADFAAWQRAQDHTAALAWWRQQLHGAPTLLDLPTDFARPQQQSTAGASQRLAVDAATRAALDRWAQAQGATLYMLLLAAFKLLLARYSGSEDVVVGTPVGHRPRPELEPVIGLFANTLALRTPLAGATRFADLLARVRSTVLDAWAHQQVPFEQVVEALDVPRHWRHAPVFQTMFLWQPAEAAAPRWQAEPLDLAATKFDLTLALAESDDGLLGRFEYRRDLFLPGSIEALATAYGQLLRELARAPDQTLARLPLWPPARQAQLQAFNQTALDHPRQLSLHEQVARQAERTPDAVAVVCGQRRLSYRQLMQQAQALALRLRAAGAGPERTVGVCLPRRAELVVSLLAVLQTGAAYVPLDPAYPAERLALIAQDAQLSALLATAEQAAAIAGLPALPRIDPFADVDAEAGANADAHAAAPSPESLAAADAGTPHAQRPDQLAYLIYTSGSTGRPKGVAIEHRQAVAMVHWALQAFTPAQRAAVLFSTSVCFDLSVYELFVPLASGGCVVVADDVLQLPTLPAAAEVTLVNTVPTACAELLRLGPLPPAVATVNLAGEPIPPALVQALYAQPPVQAVYNLYGPSEDTTYSTGLRLPRDGGGSVVPIGQPISNSEAWVLDDALQPVPPGMPGELYLAGEGVARGYWQRPALTAERFIPNPFSGQTAGHDTLYRTGDRVRQRPDGVLEFLGRIDQQVKIRGFRIELGEVEAALEAVPGVRQAVAAAQRDAHGHQRLLAWVVPQPGLADDAAHALPAVARAQLRETLPAFMVPAAIGRLLALPLLPNGKLDRQSLPVMQTFGDDPADAAASPAEAPHGATETLLAGLWADVLGLPPPGRHDGFFERGGDSILAIQLIARACEAGLPLAPRDLFLHPSLAALAARADELKAGAPAPVVHEAWVGPLPLTPAQQWFFGLPLQQRAHWNQAVLLRLPQAVPPAALAQALHTLAATHDLLRARFVHGPQGWQQHITATLDELPLLQRHCAVDSADAARATLEHEATAAQAGLSLDPGPPWRVLQLAVQHPGGTEHRLLWVMHHLLVDGVSWRILLHDLQRLLQPGVPTPPPLPRSSPLAHWLQALQERAPAFEAERPYWQQQCQAAAALLPLDTPGGGNRMADAASARRALSPALTTQLLQALPAAGRLRSDELLLTALLMALRDGDGPGARRLVLEGHGRGDLEGQPATLDLSRTVGWCTALYPLHLDIGNAGPAAALKAVRAALAAVPQHGLGWSWLRQHDAAPDPGLQFNAELRFNFLGQADNLFSAADGIRPADEASGPARHPDDPRDVLIDLNVLASRGQLQLHAGYSRGLHHAARIEALLDGWVAAVQVLLQHALSDQSDGSAVAADFPLMQLDAGALDDLLDSL